jgi:hypothetical protein
MARPWREIPEETEPQIEGNAQSALQRVRSALPEELRGRLRSARELERTLRDEEEEHPPLVTAVPALDRLLDGGLPRGHLVELVGGRTSGRFSALLTALAAATSIGESAALVDLGDALDPAAAGALGIDLERLLWVRPKDLKEALAATEMLIGAGFALVVLDLGAPPVRGGRGVEAGWLRLARSARAHGSALLVGTPYRVSGTAASAVLKAGRARALWQGGEGSPWLLGGLSARVEVEKHRRRLPGQSEGLNLTMADAPPLPRKPVDIVQTPQSVTTDLPGTQTSGRLPVTWEPLRAVGGG